MTLIQSAAPAGGISRRSKRSDCVGAGARVADADLGGHERAEDPRDNGQRAGRGRHCGGYLMADELVGTPLGDDYPSSPSARSAAGPSSGPTARRPWRGELE
jgi:hypothetical protein